MSETIDTTAAVLTRYDHVAAELDEAHQEIERLRAELASAEAHNLRCRLAVTCRYAADLEREIVTTRANWCREVTDLQRERDELLEQVETLAAERDAARSAYSELEREYDELERELDHARSECDEWAALYRRVAPAEGLDHG